MIQQIVGKDSPTETAYPQKDPKNRKKKKQVKGAKPNDKPHKAVAGIDGALFPSNKPMFNLARIEPNQVLLGVGDMLGEDAEMVLRNRLKKLGIAESTGVHTQQRMGLAAPLKKFPAPIPRDPNIPPALDEAAGPRLPSILDWLRIKNGKGPLGLSSPGFGSLG